MKREREEEEQKGQDLSDDDFGPRMEDMGPTIKKKRKQNAIKFEKFYIQVRFFNSLVSLYRHSLVLKCMKRVTCTER